jgi:hypothetical protein
MLPLVTVFSNTTPLFAFSALRRLDVIQRICGRLFVAESVIEECAVGGLINVPDLKTFPWIQIVPSPSAPDPRFFALDAGERDTLSVALERKADWVLIDERLGRNLAEYYGLAVVGTLGMLLKAKKSGLLPAFLPEVRKLQDFGFCYQENLVQRLAELAGENPV